MPKSSTMTEPVSALAAGRRAEIIGDLNANLACLTDLHLCTKQAHWNIQGPNFYGLHELLDLITADARRYADFVAERIRALRGTSHGTIADVMSMKIEPFPTDEQRWDVLARLVRERLVSCSDRLRESAGKLEDELPTQDLCLDIIRDFEKWAWMLESFLIEPNSSNSSRR